MAKSGADKVKEIPTEIKEQVQELISAEESPLRRRALIPITATLLLGGVLLIVWRRRSGSTD